MASAGGNTNPSKKRNTFFSQFLSSKNLSIFRNKTSSSSITTTPTPNNLSKESQHYKSQININTQQTPIPMCISRGWLKKRLKRPVSLDLDLVKTFTQQQQQQQSSINNNGQLVEEHQQSLNDMGTIMDRLSVLYIYLFIGKKIAKREKIIENKAGILVTKQIVDMPIKQPGKYSRNNNRLALGISVKSSTFFFLQKSFVKRIKGSF